MPVISGTAYWAKVHQPHYDQYNEQGIFSIDVTVDTKTKKQLQDLGLGPRIKNKGDERGDFVTIKRKAKRKDGSANKAPDVMDGMKRPLEGTLIGNGSAVNVLYKTYEWVHKPTGNTGVSADLQAIQVVDLVPYAGAESVSAFEEIPDGSVVTSSTTSKQEFAEIPV